MPIEFTCPGCQKTLRVSDAAAGKKARCPDCGQVGFVPHNSGFASTEGAAAGGTWSTGDWAPNEPSPESSNPFSSPHGYAQVEPVTRADVLSKVSGPAIGLIILSSINLLYVAIQFVAVFIDVALPGAFQPQQNMQGVDEMVIMGIGMGMILLFLLKDVFVIYGALQMKNMQSYSMALTAAILAMIPCGSPCCLIQLPIAIWALVILNDAEVKDAFRGAQAA